jgi:hypothetical protein
MAAAIPVLESNPVVRTTLRRARMAWFVVRQRDRASDPAAIPAPREKSTELAPR